MDPDCGFSGELADVPVGKFLNNSKIIRIIGALVPAVALVMLFTGIAGRSKAAIKRRNNPAVGTNEHLIPAEDATKQDLFEYALFAGTGGEVEILKITKNELLFRSGSDLMLLDQKDRAIKWRFHDPRRYFLYMHDRIAVFRHEDRLYNVDVDTRLLVSKLSDSELNVDATTTRRRKEYRQELIGDESRCSGRPTALIRVDWLMYSTDRFLTAPKVEGRSWMAISCAVDRDLASQLTRVRVVGRYSNVFHQDHESKKISSLARHNGVFYLGTADGSIVALYPNADSINRIGNAGNINTRTGESYVKINSEVPQASIFLDGDILGQSRTIVGPLWEGFYRISASCSGFADAKVDIFLNYNESLHVSVPLEFVPHNVAYLGVEPMPINLYPDMVLTDDRKLVMIADNGIGVMEPTTLTILWAESTPTRPKVVLIRDRIIMAFEGNIELRDLHHGTVDYSIKLKKQLIQLQNSGNVLVCTFGDGTSEAFDLANGESLWRKKKSGRGALAHGLYIQTNGSDMVSAFEPRSGRMMWRTRTSDVGMAIGGNSAAIYTYNEKSGYLRAFDAREGSLIWQESRVRPTPSITQLKIAYYRSLQIGDQTICFLAVRDNEGLQIDTAEFVVAPNQIVDLSSYINHGYLITSSASEWFLYRPETAEKPLLTFDSDRISYSVGKNTILIAEGEMLYYFDTRTMLVTRTVRYESSIRDISFTGNKFYILTAAELVRIDSS